MAEEEKLKLPELKVMQICSIDFGKCKKRKEIEKEFNPSQVFLDIPYSGYNKKNERAIKKVIESYGLTPVLAETKATQEGLLCNVCKTIQKSGYAVADISRDGYIDTNQKEYNPNVMFELGIIFGLGRKYCILCHSNTKVPVDLRGLIINKYNNKEDIEKNVSKWITDNVGDIAIKISKRKKIIEGILFQLERGDIDQILHRIEEIKNLGIMNVPTSDYIKFIDKLIDSLKHDDFRIRWLVIDALGEIGDSRAVEPLIATLEDEDFNVQRCSIDALGRIRDPRAIEPLVDILKMDEDLREIATKALCMIGTSKVIESLMGLLESNDVSVIYYAKKAIKKIKSAQRKNKKK